MELWDSYWTALGFFTRPGIANIISMTDDNLPLREIPWGNDFSSWLNNRQVFSLAFTDKSTLSYTTGMELAVSEQLPL